MLRRNRPRAFWFLVPPCEDALQITPPPPTATTSVPAVRLFTSTHLEADQHQQTVRSPPHAPRFKTKTAKRVFVWLAGWLFVFVFVFVPVSVSVSVYPRLPCLHEASHGICMWCRPDAVHSTVLLRRHQTVPSPAGQAPMRACNATPQFLCPHFILSHFTSCRDTLP